MIRYAIMKGKIIPFSLSSNGARLLQEKPEDRFIKVGQASFEEQFSQYWADKEA